MRTAERLIALQEWTYKACCKGRKLKVPPPGQDITKYLDKREPSIFLNFMPMRPDQTATIAGVNPPNVAPSITLLIDNSMGKYMEDKRFDTYNKVHRTKTFGQQLNIQALFTVYEDGVRLPGFIDKVEANPEDFDMTLIREGTQEGLFTLLNWMDDYRDSLIATKIIPDSDMYVNEESIIYTLREDQKYPSDNRPLFYGVVNVSFNCYSEHKDNPEIRSILD